MKLQQEIRLSGDKTMSQQTFLVTTGMMTIQETLLQQEPTEMLSQHRNWVVTQFLRSCIETMSQHNYQCRNITVTVNTHENVAAWNGQNDRPCRTKWYRTKGRFVVIEETCSDRINMLKKQILSRRNAACCKKEL